MREREREKERETDSFSQTDRDRERQTDGVIKNANKSVHTKLKTNSLIFQELKKDHESTVTPKEIYGRT